MLNGFLQVFTSIVCAMTMKANEHSEKTDALDSKNPKVEENGVISCNKKFEAERQSGKTKISPDDENATVTNGIKLNDIKSLSENVNSPTTKKNSSDVSDCDIYEGIEDDVINLSNPDFDDKVGDSSQDDNLLEDDIDQSFRLKMTPSPRSVKSTNTEPTEDVANSTDSKSGFDGCLDIDDINDISDEKKLDFDETMDSMNSETCVPIKDASVLDKDDKKIMTVDEISDSAVSDICELNCDVDAVDKDSEKSVCIADSCDISSEKRKCSAEQEDRKLETTNSVTDSREDSKNVVEQMVNEMVISVSKESMDFNDSVVKGDDDSTKKRKLSENSGDDFSESKKLRTNSESEFANKIDSGDEKSNKKRPNLFQILTESKIKFDKINPAKLKSPERKEEDGHSDGSNVDDVKVVEVKLDKEDESEGITSKTPNGKNKIVKIEIAEKDFEQELVRKMQKIIDEQVEKRYAYLLKRYTSLEAAFIKEKRQSHELQKEVTQLNLALSKATSEFQKINTKKRVPQRTVGLQVRFSTETSLAKVEKLAAYEAQNMKMNPRSSQTAPQLASSQTNPQVKPGSTLTPTLKTYSHIPKTISLSSQSTPTTMSVTAVKANSNANPAGAALPNSTVKKNAQLNAVTKSLPSQTSLVNIIDLTADEDEGKNNKSKEATAAKVPVPITPVIPLQAIRPQINSNNPGGSLLLANSNQLVFAPSNLNSPAVLIRPNNVITNATVQQAMPNQSSVPPASVVVNTVRLPSPVVHLAGSNTKITSIPVSAQQPITTSTPKGSSHAISTIKSPSTSLESISQLKHPAPLPRLISADGGSNLKLKPPQPVLRTSRVRNGIVLSWSMTLDPLQHATIGSYMLYAYQESSARPSVNMWKKVGDVKALPLPMACTLTHFMEGHKYHFAVCALDVHKRFGLFSKPASILLTPK